MTHAIHARKKHGAKIAVVDVYRTPTMEQADIPLLIRPGTDGALACAVMHVLFRDGFADRAYLDAYARDAEALEGHLATRTPEWASALCGLPVAEIEAYARLVGTTPAAYFRIGYGFSRSRNGAVNMHAVASIPVVAGSWQHEGGGAPFHVRQLWLAQEDDRRAGPARSHRARPRPVPHRPHPDGRNGCAGGRRQGGGAPHPEHQSGGRRPEQDKVKRGFAREDLFVAVHEQFMTDTAKMADIVLPATMFTEHDDLYGAGGHPHIQIGTKIVEPPGECRTNHDVICALASRLGAEHPGFAMTARELIDWTLRESGRGPVEALEEARFMDVAQDFRAAHFLDGFAHRDKRFHFAVDWVNLSFPRRASSARWRTCRPYPTIGR